MFTFLSLIITGCHVYHVLAFRPPHLIILITESDDIIDKNYNYFDNSSNDGCELPPDIARGLYNIVPIKPNTTIDRISGSIVPIGTTINYECSFDALPSIRSATCGDHGWGFTSIPICLVPEKNCTLPPQLQNGKYELRLPAQKFRLDNNTVAAHSQLVFRCDEDTLVYPIVSEARCLDGWDSQIPQCRKLCPNINGYELNVVVNCTLDDSETDCADSIAGTRAAFQCRSGYVSDTIDSSSYRYCNEDGTWDAEIPTCYQGCGYKNLGLIAPYPWHVGVYNKRLKKFLCSGSIITSLAILTAGNCFCYKSNCTDTMPSEIVVAAGKDHASLISLLDPGAQYANVTRILLPNGFRDGYDYNIGLLGLETPLQINQFVSPVCLDDDPDFNSSQLLDQDGFVVGWPWRTNALLSERIGEKAVKYQECANVTSISTQFEDKLCAPFVNDTNAELCPSYGGTGVVFRNDNGRYYVRGVAINSAFDYSCYEILNLYTSTQYHLDFIKNGTKIIKQDYIQNQNTRNLKEGNCEQPPPLANGKWELLQSAVKETVTLRLWDDIENGTIITFTCYDDYVLYPNITSAVCSDGWKELPKCLKPCPPIQHTSAIKIECNFENNTVPCDSPLHGYKAVITCPHLYEIPPFLESPLGKCQADGTWKLPKCQPVCGFKSTTAQKYIIGGSIAKPGEYPWHVAIHTRNNKETICGGSLISSNLIISAAHCFGEDASLDDPSGYFVSAGKFYRKYEDPRDLYEQYANVSKLVFHQYYRGDDKHYENDIVLMVLETALEMTKYVLPVCVDYSQSVDDLALSGKLGIITGWGYTTSNNAPSDALKELVVEFKAKEACNVSGDFRAYYDLVPDKICAGLTNHSASACQGDSGGGLVSYDSHRFYLRGIVSLGAIKDGGGCDITQYTLFTSIQRHLDLIQSVINEYAEISID